MALRIEPEAEPIPGYRLISRLGGGGYGDVWKCEAPGGLNKAIKFVFGQLGSSENVMGEDVDDVRAAQELKSLERIKKIRHPFILALDRYEIKDGQLMIVSELADCSLFDRFRECHQQGMKGIPRDELLNYMLETAEALDYMTEKHDLLHLDIKPQNLFLLCNHIKIGDFGLVKDVEGKLANVTGGFTTNYAAPESFEGFVSRFSDQYSLAIVYQELLTGSRPYTGTNIKQILLQHIQGKPKLDPLPASDRPIIERALAKAPSDRWPSSMAMVKSLVCAKSVRSDYDPETMMMAHRQGETNPELVLPHEERISLSHSASVNRNHQRVGIPHPQPSESINKARTANFRELGLLPQHSQAGVLRPVIMIGLGQMGRAVLQTMKQEVLALFGTTEFPLLRLLAIDTDATRPGRVLVEKPHPEDLLVMTLSRPARYVRTRDDLPPVETWLDPELLYRMPRTLITSGIRGLGRLAFIEHYAEFVSRFERELAEVLSDETQAQACKISKSAMRNAEPLVYLVTHLGGGTGSGMFLDCAYAVHSIMKNRQLSAQDVGAIFLTPQQREDNIPDLAEANAVAAIHELFHYQQAGSTFRAQYQSKAEPVVHSSAPFNHCLFLETPLRKENQNPGQSCPAAFTLQRLAMSLSRLFYTSLGQVADPSWLSRSSEAMYQSMGSRVVGSSRHEVIQRASASLCNQMIDHWLKPLNTGLLSEAQSLVNVFIEQERLGSSELLKYLEIAVATVLQQSSEQYARRLLEPLSVPIKVRLPQPSEIENSLKEILSTLGSNKRDDSVSVSVLQPSTKVSRVLREAVDRRVQSAATHLKSSVHQLVDRANRRLGLADEVLRNTVCYFEQRQQHHAQLALQQQEKFAEELSFLKSDLQEYERLRSTAKFLWPKLPAAGERMLVIYHTRYQALMHEQVASIYSSLRSQCNGISQQLRNCRSKLLDVRQMRNLQDDLSSGSNLGASDCKSLLIPHHFTDVSQMSDQVINNIISNQIELIDERLARKLSSSSTPLVELTQSSSDVLNPLRQLILDELSCYLDQTLPTDDLAAMFADYYPDSAQAISTLQDEIHLPVSLTQQTQAYEIDYVMLPQSEQSSKIEAEVRESFPNTMTLQSSQTQEIVIHRAVLGIQLFELSVMNEACLQAYETAKAIDHFTPHARQDIEQWHNPIVHSPTAQLQVQQ
ncbi:MAG TPA: tubulin-like doman-containing protein [Gemmatales bacterium]|nr:tubulin-like doman-containing protein [Gemmatales bacterium]